MASKLCLITSAKTFLMIHEIVQLALCLLILVEVVHHHQHHYYGISTPSFYSKVFNILNLVHDSTEAYGYLMLTGLVSLLAIIGLLLDNFVLLGILSLRNVFYAIEHAGIFKLEFYFTILLTVCSIWLTRVMYGTWLEGRAALKAQDDVNVLYNRMDNEKVKELQRIVVD